MPEVEITVKCSNQDKVQITADNGITIAELKELISSQLNIAASLQRLIFKGRVLKDESTMEFYEIDSGSIVHLVKGYATTSKPSSASSPSTQSSPVSSAPVTNPPAPSPFEFPGMGLGGMGGMNPMAGMGGFDMASMQQQLQQNPEMMQQIMNSPMMESMMNNPEMMRSMMMNNPQVQAMLDANPHIRHVLNDPSVMRQTMEMMRNPNAMREAMRSQDLAMSQLENIPGGFNALRRMYEDVQEPMMNAQVRPTPTSSTPSQNAAPPSQAPNTSALPNPWGAPPAATPAFGGFGGMSGGMPGMGMGMGGMPGAGMGMGGMPGGMGGMPGAGMGMGGMPGAGMGMGGMPGGMNPAQLGAMMENPMMQQMMQQMLSDPAMIQQMSAGNPQLAAALQNPQTRAMLTNPAMLRQLSNPATMQALMQMQQSMQTLQNAGFPMFPGAVPGAMGGFPQPAPGGLDFSSLLGAGGVQPPTGFGYPPVSAPVSSEPPAQRFASQLQQMQDMGFTDTPSNIAALTASNGCVTGAVERLLGSR